MPSNLQRGIPPSPQARQHARRRIRAAGDSQLAAEGIEKLVVRGVHSLSVAHVLLRDALPADLGGCHDALLRGFWDPELALHRLFGHFSGFFRVGPVLRRQPIPVVSAQHDGELRALDGIHAASLQHGRILRTTAGGIAIRVEKNTKCAVRIVRCRDGARDEVSKPAVGSIQVRRRVPEVDDLDSDGFLLFQRR